MMNLPAPNVLDDLAALLTAEAGMRAGLQAIIVRTPEGASARLDARNAHDMARGYIVDTCRAIVAKADAP
jgi:hypothetical protein